MAHMARLRYANGHSEDRVFPHQQRDSIVLPALVNGEITTVSFVFDRFLSDFDAIPTFVEHVGAGILESLDNIDRLLSESD